MSRFDGSIRLVLVLFTLAPGLIACGDSEPREITYEALNQEVAEYDAAQLAGVRVACEAELERATAELARSKEEFEGVPVAEIQSAKAQGIREASTRATRRIQELRACLSLLDREETRRGTLSGSP